MLTRASYHTYCKRPLGGISSLQGTYKISVQANTLKPPKYAIPYTCHYYRRIEPLL